MSQPKKSEFAPVLKITLYLPDGTPEEYLNCTIGGSLVPELEFYGSKRVKNWSSYYWFPFRARWLSWIKFERFLCVDTSRHAHITSTTLPYKIEEVLD